MISLRPVLTPKNLTSVRALEIVTGILDSSVRRQAERAPIVRHHQRGGDLRPVGKRFVKPHSASLLHYSISQVILKGPLEFTGEAQ